MEYLIRFAQLHETFRLPELQSLASLVGTDLEIVHYDPCVCAKSPNSQFLAHAPMVKPPPQSSPRFVPRVAVKAKKKKKEKKKRKISNSLLVPILYRKTAK